MKRHGFMLLEIIPVLMVVAMLSLIVILALNPGKHSEEARNAKREHDIALLADAIASFTKDKGAQIFRLIPMAPANSIEICADVQTGSCTSLLDLRPLIGTYLHHIPIDPSATDTDTFPEHSRYFVARSGTRIIVSAADTEPAGAEDLTAGR